MIKRPHTLLLVFILASFLTNRGTAEQKPEVELFQLRALTRSKPFQRWWWDFQQRAYPLSDIPKDALLRALQEIKLSKVGLLAKSQMKQSGRWVNIGPAPLLDRAGFSTRAVSGRVADVAVDPSDPNHWLIGAAQGGIWETRDAGTTWIPKTDDQVSMAMGAIAFAPSNPTIIYAGTGEASFSGVSYAGAGLLKSTDGGATWQLLAASTFAKSSFSDIKVHPTNPDIVLATTTRGIAGRVRRGRDIPPTAPARGIFKSTDGGVTWARKLDGEATDLEIDPSNFDNQYAGIGEIFGSESNGVYRSTDGGETWARSDGPWVSLPGGIGRVELAIAPSASNVLYISIQDAINTSDENGFLLGLWRTDDAWASTPAWTTLPLPSLDQQWWYDHEIIVAPTNSNILFAGGVRLWRFDGRTWTEISSPSFNPFSGIHVDQHSMAWVGDRLIVGNDGGAWSTTDRGSSWSNHNTDLSITQFYDGSIHPTNPNFIIAGSQDNGTQQWTGTTSWQDIFGGDGADNAISSSNPDTHWAISFQRLEILRTTMAGALFVNATSGIDKTNAPFIARFEKCPSNDNLFIAATDNLWKTTSFFSAPAPFWVSNGPEMGAGISALAFASSDAACNTYAYGTTTGDLRLTTDGGNTWVDIDAGSTVPNRYVTDLAFHPTAPNILYVTLSGFDEGTPDQPGHVFKTVNALAASPDWLNISPPVNLPHITIALHPASPDTVYVGTDVGVWKSTDGGSAWSHHGPETGMPHVAVFELQISPDGRVVAFTHGRGAFLLSEK
jgi:photosystem II stability/assembly factor-like uncharacterized protein